MTLNLAMNIFNADPDAKPREPKTFEGPEFSVVAYDYDDGPVKLDGWMFKAAKPSTADALQELFGGRSADIDHKRFTTAVYTDVTSLDIVITDVSSDMKLWNGSTLTHHCDGNTYLSDPPGRGSAGDPCECPDTIKERKQAAKDKWGPRPDIRVSFRLAGPGNDLGKGEMKTGSWDLSGELESYLADRLTDAAADDSKGEIAAELFIKTVEFEIKKGKNAGTVVSYQYPSLRNIRAWNEAIAE